MDGFLELYIWRGGKTSSAQTDSILQLSLGVCIRIIDRRNGATGQCWNFAAALRCSYSA